MYSVDQLFDYLTSATSSPPRQSSPLNNSHVDTVVQILERWPVSQRFPGMLMLRFSIIRLMVRKQSLTWLV